jgi:prepilin-type N-terminal cleavage/methylation domain-containing protein
MSFPPQTASDRLLVRRTGFSLVELLVAIAIIAVLIGILLPVLNRVRESSRRTVCLANLRTIGQCIVMYANDSRDRLPNNNPPGVWDSYAAAAVLVEFANEHVKSPRVFHCPGDSDPAPEFITTADYFVPNSARTSYEFYSVFWAPEYGPKLVRIPQAPLAWDFDGGSRVPTPVQNHGVKGGNVVYGDGHADWQEVGRWDDISWPNPAAAYYPLP